MIMATINDKLTYLTDTKAAIKQAIIAKGVTVEDNATFRSYADKIGSIETGGSIAGAPSGMRFANSTFTTVPSEILPYLEQQTNLNGIFQSCKNLTTVPLFDTSKCTNMQYMFSYCENLTSVPQFDTSKCTDMDDMFSGCTSLQTVPQFDTSNVTIISSMFYKCTSLQTVPQFGTSKCISMADMFSGCTSLQTVPQFDTSNVTIISSMFYNCTSLANLGGFTGLKKDLNLKYSPLLTVDSVMNIITEAADMTSSPRTLTLNATVFNKLSVEQINTANAKGWNIAK